MSRPRPSRGEAGRLARALARAALLVFGAFAVAARAAPEPGPPAPGPERADRAAAAGDSLAEPRSLRARIVALLSDYIVAQPTDSLLRGLVSPEEVYRPYDGRIIRSIVIEQLDIFSGMPGGGGRETDTVLQGLARRLHRETRAAVIRQHLLMKAGDRLDPFTLVDTEHILRSTAFLQDARIAVVPVAGQPDLVDLLVVTRDVWSLGFSLPVNRLDELRVRVYERNLLGYGHDFEYRAWFERPEMTLTRWEGRYRIGNILGRFLRAEVELGDRESERWQRAALGRSPIAPQIRLAGGLACEQFGTKDLADTQAGRYSERFVRLDGWLGYNLILGRNEAGGPGRTALMPAIRATWTNYRECPRGAAAPTPLAYQDRVLLLGGIQLGRNEYRQTRLVHALGETEDIPVGYVLGVSGGQELGRCADRLFAGAQAGGFGDIGLPWMVGARVACGAYRRQGGWEDGVIDGRLNAFSSLGRLARFRLRHFVQLRHTAAVHRLDDSDRLELDQRTGIRGLRTSGIAGRQRTVLDLESVAFTPWVLFGFKVAAYGFCDIGAVAPAAHRFLRARYYESLGVGVRLRNERLVFDTIDLQLAFMPSPPPDADTQTARFRSAPRPEEDPWLVGPPGPFEYR